MSILLLNYSHPLTADQEAQLGTMLAAPLEVRNLATHVDRTRPLAEVAGELADRAELSNTAWQTTPFVLNPPALAPVALALIAELHGRCGSFPTLIHVRPVADSLPTRYEIAELLNLQTVRDTARMRR